MKWEYKGKTIELFLVGIHHPNYPKKIWKEAKAIWKVVIDGKESSGTRSGNREEVLQKLKDHIDWLIDDPDMTQLF
jgi:hypothetical protein